MGFFFGKTLGYQEGHLIGSFFSFPLSHLGWDTNLSEERKEMRQICKHTWQWCGFLIYWLGDPPRTGLSMLTQYLCQVLNTVSCCLEVSSSQRFLEKTNFPLPVPIVFSLCRKAKEFIPWWETCLAPSGQPPSHRPEPSGNSTAAALIYTQGLLLLYGHNQPHWLARDVQNFQKTMFLCTPPPIEGKFTQKESLTGYDLKNKKKHFKKHSDCQ